MSSAIQSGNDQFECAQYKYCSHNSFIPDRFFYVGTPDYEYYFKRKFFFSQMGEIGDKLQVKDHLLEHFHYTVPTRNQLAKVFFYVTYKYDVDEQVLNDNIAQNNDNKVKGNN